MKIFYILLISISLLQQTTSVASDHFLVTSPTGFWIAPSDITDRSLYGPTDYDADWRVSQWETPAYDLPPFKNNVTRNGRHRVKLEQHRWEIAQSGRDLQCGLEFSGLVEANLETNGYPGFPLAGPKSKPIGQMSVLLQHIAVEPEYANVVKHNCKVTQGQLLTVIALTNFEADQVLFYQIGLLNINMKQNKAWWWKGPRLWGYNDYPSSYNLTQAEIGQRTEYTFDMLPRLKQVISSKKEAGLDQNLNNWHITSVYHGGHVWGHVGWAAWFDSFIIVGF